MVPESTEKRGPGRPLDPESRRQGRRISGRLSLAEYDLLKGAAGDLPLWTWLVEVATAEAQGLALDGDLDVNLDGMAGLDDISLDGLELDLTGLDELLDL